MTQQVKKRGGFGRRVLGWGRTAGKLALVVLSYFWLGAGYKLVYAQTHDLNRFKGRLPISYYQQQFLIDSLIHQTWMFGPAFRDTIGELPSLAALASANPQKELAAYCRRREEQLLAVPERYPRSVFADEALDDAFFYSQAASFLGIFGASERPRQILASPERGGSWTTTAVPDFSRSTVLAERLANEYPESPRAAAALLRVAEGEARTSVTGRSREAYERLAQEYPRSEEGEAAAEALYSAAMARGDLERARDYKRIALTAAERTARERFAGQALPAANTVSILGYRVDLSRIELQLARAPVARELLTAAAEEATRVASLPALDGDIEDRLRERRRRMERVRSELWVTDLYEALEVGAPGPPPRPREQDVSGIVTVDGEPVAGIDILLLDQAPRRGFQSAVGSLQAARYRATTDRKGRYRLTGVTPGAYRLAALYAAEPEALNGVPLVPGAGGKAAVPARITVSEGATTLPAVALRRGIRTKTFGEAAHRGDAIRLEWEPHPGAASYRVEVLAGTGFAGMFARRPDRGRGSAFWRRPVLWSQDAVKETYVDCPLEPLAPPGGGPFGRRMAQYEYAVTALDANGKELAVSSTPLSRFHPSAAARDAMERLRRRRPRSGEPPPARRPR